MFTKRLDEYGGLRTMTPVAFRIHWYSIGLVVYRARRAVHALIFFTAINSPITQGQITDYIYI